MQNSRKSAGDESFGCAGSVAWLGESAAFYRKLLILTGCRAAASIGSSPALQPETRPRRLAWPRTSPFHGGNTGSNPVGDAKSFQQLTISPPPLYRHKKGTIWGVNPPPTSCGRQCFGLDQARLSRHREGTLVRFSASSCSGRAQKTNDVALGFSLLKRHCLCICIQRDSAGGVTKELLRDLDIRSVCSQQ